jgi:hypothetical protein
MPRFCRGHLFTIKTQTSWLRKIILFFSSERLLPGLPVAVALVIALMSIVTAFSLAGK